MRAYVFDNPGIHLSLAILIERGPRAASERASGAARGGCAKELSAQAAVEAGRGWHSSAGSSVSSGRSPPLFADGEHSAILRRADRRRSALRPRTRAGVI